MPLAFFTFSRVLGLHLASTLDRYFPPTTLPSSSQCYVSYAQVERIGLPHLAEIFALCGVDGLLLL
eukprot:3769642-Pyramimonas_sp.AAC.1